MPSSNATSSTTSTHEAVYSCLSQTDMARKQIDQKIENLDDAFEIVRQKYETDLRAVKSQRNMLSPISRLSPEILSTIFLFRSSLADVKPLAWIKITHVCSHWREVALKCPNLWTNLTNWDRPLIMQEMLSRSSAVPLSIKAHLCREGDRRHYKTNTIQSVVSRTAKLREIDLSATVPNDLANIFADISDAAPNLVALKIACKAYSVPFKIPDALFQGGTPKLRRLDLWGCQIKWDSPLLHGLTHLILSCKFVEDFSTEQVCTTLEKLPELEVLYLGDYTPNTQSNSGNRRLKNAVRLPRLASLRLSGQNDPCAQLLECISIPTTTVIRVSSTQPQKGDGDFNLPLLRAIKSACMIACDGVTHMDDFRTLVISPLNKIHFTFWTEEISPREVYMVGEKISLLLDADPTPGSLTRMLSCLPLSHLSTVCLWNSGLDEMTWIESFSRIMSLRRISFSSCHYPAGLVAAIKHPFQRHPSRATTAVNFPHLDSLAFEEVVFTRLQDPDSDAWDLQRALAQRKQVAGYSIRRATIVDCINISSEIAEELKKVVEHLEWDGSERQDEDYSGEESFDDDED